MNVVVLPIVFAALMISMLGIYHTSTNSEQSITQNSIDTITALSERKNEVLDARIVGSSILVQSHSQKDSEIFLIDFILNDGEKKRIIYSNDDSFDGDTLVHEIRRDQNDAPVIGTSERYELSLKDIGITPSEITSASLLTERGNRFLIDIPARQGDGSGEGSEDTALAMVNGMGLSTRIIQKDIREAIIIHGTGMQGEYSSLKPYFPVSSGTDFAALIKSKGTETTHAIPEFFKSYQNHKGTLIDTNAVKPNILGYTDKRLLTGNAVAEITNNGIILSGSGEILLKLHDYTGEMIISGDATNATFQIVTTKHDLINESYTSRGYRTHSETIDPSSTSFSIVAGIDSLHTGVLDLYAHTTSRHIHADGNYRACYSGNSNYGQAVVSTFHYPAKATTFSYTPERRGCNYDTQVEISTNLIKLDKTSHYIITGDSYTPEILRYTDQSRTKEMSVRQFSLYDTLPGIQLVKWSGNHFKEKIEFSEETYLHAKLDGITVTLKGESHDTNDVFFEAHDLPANTPYQIFKDGLPIISGMSDGIGRISIEEFVGLSSTLGGVLQMYPDSIKYRGAFSTVVFDEFNSKTLHIDTAKDLVYTVHAYALIFVTGDVTVANLNLDETLAIPYLDGRYTSGDTIHVPIIPGHKRINLEINGIQAVLEYSNILGGTGIRIAAPATSTISQNSPGSPIHSVTAVAGTVAYSIATGDGTLKAIISETVSGEIKIANTYNLQRIPPPPPRPPNNDPLSGNVDIHVNGVLVKQITLGVNPNPAFTPISIGGLRVLQGVTYSYPDYVFSGSVSVPVQAGDFVEFYVYGLIHGEIIPYDTPSGFTILSSSGVASASVNIRSAYITTDM